MLPLQPQLHIVDTPETDEQQRDSLFITKARDRLHRRVPKYHGPRTDDWGLWRNQWTTACKNSLHPARDGDGRRFAIKEALRGEAAIQAQGVSKDSRYLTAYEMLAELDKFFMPFPHSRPAGSEDHGLGGPRDTVTGSAAISADLGTKLGVKINPSRL
ncbi:MAG: hypothetical protein GY696_21540 [Gammaproteobacteria bacterium]|nr:hypothetical protein [Gammaproteobacteria bacterium]